VVNFDFVTNHRLRLGLAPGRAIYTPRRSFFEAKLANRMGPKETMANLSIVMVVPVRLGRPAHRDTGQGVQGILSGITSHDSVMPAYRDGPLVRRDRINTMVLM
jgi:hypothetical protein